MKNKKRPFWYKFLIVSLLVISLAGWLRLYQSIYQWHWLLAYGVKPGSVYTAICGALSGLAAVAGALVLWLRLPWSKRYVQICVGILTLADWLEYLLFTHSSAGFTNLPFRLLVTLLYLSFVYLYLHFSGVEKANPVEKII